jgi:hypothetical protein
MSAIRSRSLSRTRVTKLTDAFPSGEALDPVALLSELSPHIKDFDIPLSVTLSDGENTVGFLLSIFVSKEYEVIDDKVKLGFKRLNIRSLKVNISYDVKIQD